MKKLKVLNNKFWDGCERKLKVALEIWMVLHTLVLFFGSLICSVSLATWIHHQGRHLFGALPV